MPNVNTTELTVCIISYNHIYTLHPLIIPKTQPHVQQEPHDPQVVQHPRSGQHQLRAKVVHPSQTRPWYYYAYHTIVEVHGNLNFLATAMQFVKYLYLYCSIYGTEQPLQVIWCSLYVIQALHLLLLNTWDRISNLLYCLTINTRNFITCFITYT